MMILLTIYYSGDQVKEDEMSGVCSMCGTEDKCIQGCCEETCRNEVTWKT
jgi:hypothetical protein